MSTPPEDGTRLEPEIRLFEAATAATCPLGAQVVYLAVRDVPYEGLTTLQIRNTAMGAVRAITRRLGRSKAAREAQWTWGGHRTYGDEQESLWSISITASGYETYRVLAMEVHGR